MDVSYGKHTWRILNAIEYKSLHMIIMIMVMIMMMMMMMICYICIAVVQGEQCHGIDIVKEMRNPSHTRTKLGSVLGRLVLFLLEDHRSAGHHVLCAAQEEQSGLVPACLSSYDHRAILMGLSEVRARRTGRHHRHPQLGRAYHYVLLLHGRRYGTPVPEVSVVEEVHDHHSADSVCAHPWLHAHRWRQGLQHAQDADLLLCGQHDHLPLSVWQLLSQDLPEEQDRRCQRQCHAQWRQEHESGSVGSEGCRRHGLHANADQEQQQQQQQRRL